jgi:hypothetical protein
MASKMYILVKGPESGVDLGHAVLAAAHASLGGYLTFRQTCAGLPVPEDPVEEWVRNSFRKVVCKVSDAEFEKAKTYGKPGEDFRVMTESGLGGMEVAIVFRPREDFEPFFKSLKLYR